MGKISIIDLIPSFFSFRHKYSVSKVFNNHFIFCVCIQHKRLENHYIILTREFVMVENIGQVCLIDLANVVLHNSTR